MLCPKCGATSLEGAGYCFSCGERLPEAMGVQPVVQAPKDQESNLFELTEPVAPGPVAEAATVAAAPYSVLADGVSGGQFGWFEQADAPTYYAVPLDANPPVRRGPKHPGLWLLFSVGLCGLIVAVVFGGIFAFVSSTVSHVNGVSLVQPTSTITPEQGGDQVYKQVMSQSPLYTASLQDPTAGGWLTGKVGPDACTIKPDGFHIYLARTNRYLYCSSGHGALENFAFQVDMKLLYGPSDAGGGMVIRADSTKSSFYYFSIEANGHYFIRLRQNGSWGKSLDIGTSNSFIRGYGNTNTLMAIAQGNTLYFYVNQKLLTIIKDSTYTSGYLGLKVNTTSSVAEVVYTNAKIWLL